MHVNPISFSRMSPSSYPIAPMVAVFVSVNITGLQNDCFFAGSGYKPEPAGGCNFCKITELTNTHNLPVSKHP